MVKGEHHVQYTLNERYERICTLLKANAVKRLSELIAESDWFKDNDAERKQHEADVAGLVKNLPKPEKVNEAEIYAVMKEFHGNLEYFIPTLNNTEGFEDVRFAYDKDVREISEDEVYYTCEQIKSKILPFLKRYRHWKDGFSRMTAGEVVASRRSFSDKNSQGYKIKYKVIGSVSDGVGGRSELLGAVVCAAEPYPHLIVVGKSGSGDVSEVDWAVKDIVFLKRPKVTFYSEYFIGYKGVERTVVIHHNKPENNLYSKAFESAVPKYPYEEPEIKSKLIGKVISGDYADYDFYAEYITAIVDMPESCRLEKDGDVLRFDRSKIKSYKRSEQDIRTAVKPRQCYMTIEFTDGKNSFVLFDNDHLFEEMMTENWRNGSLD